jgi:hypothetical protein
MMNISVISAVIPYSFWAIPTATLIPITYGVSNQTRNLTIKAGNYSATQIATQLTDSTAGLTVTYDSGTGFFNFATNASNQVTFPAQAVNSYIGISTSGVTIPLNTSLYVPPLAPNISGPRAIQVQTSIPIENTNTGAGGNATLCWVPIDVNPNNFIVYKPGSGIPIKQIAKCNSFNDITITLTDETGTQLDFKGVPWSVDICFEILVPPDSIGKDYAELTLGGGLFDAMARGNKATKKFISQ